MSKNLLAGVCLWGLVGLSGGAVAQLPQPDGGNLERGVLPSRWLSQKPKCMDIPEWQVHEYNPNFFILRQSPCTDYEKPFIFLFFGKEKAMLVDTGSRNGNLAPALQLTIHNWLKRNGRSSIPLIVTHTHEHEDHIWGDKALLAMNDPAIPVTFVAAEVEAVKQFFGVANWPTDIGHVDLGGRMIDLIPIPGHGKVSVAFYDRNTGILLAGDSMYPGRLYVSDFASFQASTERLIRFTDGKPVAHILGNHIEETSTPFLDYPVGTIYQPNEHELALARGSLLELEDARLRCTVRRGAWQCVISPCGLQVRGMTARRSVPHTRSMLRRRRRACGTIRNLERVCWTRLKSKICGDSKLRLRGSAWGRVF